MSEPAVPGFFVRFFLAFGVYFRFLFNREFAGAVLRIGKGEITASTGETPPIEARPQSMAPMLKEAPPDSALQLLGLLQQEGRFIDFIEEDVARFSDADIGAAVRVVHEGCRKVLHDHMMTGPVREEQEGARVTLHAGFDASAIRLTGKVVGQPPFSGTLVHRGWRVNNITLPKLAEGHDVKVLAPAEIEL
ncbi:MULTISPECIES: DUF2760 domain-containing protein [Nitrosomonas]|uniref:Uncharacterized protein DUF2760 n=1 Tax=Nitrosomonas communis TaxID=44574 RepID=A0A0F7KEB2_9PROT|nr:MULTISPECIES: DUF2760 domain-containing protein [Nitrosomonas]AKH37164.1 hypothetical protein AAW31_03965 [Nitrosomonas communis]TYP94510.1 uncharacterized protein DUF2760 [Nitrosomonas communis]UVS62338.1 DUF2760 domain-containing protein [Nitrosomonas sp. PLL12]